MTLVLDGLLAFLADSPSPFHAVRNAAALLEAQGFSRLEAGDAWPDSARTAYVVRGGAIIAWRVPAQLGAATAAHIVGAHTDSPNLRIKPQPDIASVGWRQLGVEVYGGALVNSWLDRDLGISGRLVLRDLTERLVRIDRPLARIAQLAIHLDREVNEKGLVLDRQQHLTPIWGLGDGGSFREWLATEAGVAAPDDIASWDLMFHDLTPPVLLGVDREFIAASRLDNLFSVYCAVRALLDSGSADTLNIVALFDHEEVGSGSTSGAAGPLLESVLDRLFTTYRIDRHRALANSSCISADMAHAVHPNYPERHEPGHRPIPNAGPVLKINATQRYATDAATAAMFASVCRRADVPMQTFVSRNNIPCGTTIGPITATRLGIATVDVGCAQLSMHSARELAGAQDADFLVRAMRSYLGE